MALIRKTFTYDLPDDYLSQERTLGKTAEWEYIGPDAVWVLISKETNKYTGRYFTDEHDGHEIPTPIDCYKLHIDCEQDPLLCSLFHVEVEKPDYADLDQHEELLPDGLHYRRPLHPPPDHTHSVQEMTFDPESGSYLKPYPWKLPHSSWPAIRAWRNRLLEITDDKEGDHLDDGFPESLATAWADFRQNLRDVPQVHGAENFHTSIDMTAEAPYNQLGSNLVKVIDASGVNVGDDIGVRGWPVEDIFGGLDHHSVVVSVDKANNVVELDHPLIMTPIEDFNHQLSFSPCPGTEAHKIGAYTAPDGTGGPDGHNNHPDFDPADPTKRLGDPLRPGHAKT